VLVGLLDGGPHSLLELLFTTLFDHNTTSNNNQPTNQPPNHPTDPARQGMGYWEYTLNELGIYDAAAQIEKLHEVKLQELGGRDPRLDLRYAGDLMSSGGAPAPAGATGPSLARPSAPALSRPRAPGASGEALFGGQGVAAGAPRRLRIQRSHSDQALFSAYAPPAAIAAATAKEQGGERSGRRSGLGAWLRRGGRRQVEGQPHAAQQQQQQQQQEKDAGRRPRVGAAIARGVVKGAVALGSSMGLARGGGAAAGGRHAAAAADGSDQDRQQVAAGVDVAEAVTAAALPGKHSKESDTAMPRPRPLSALGGSLAASLRGAFSRSSEDGRAAAAAEAAAAVAAAAAAAAAADEEMELLGGLRLPGRGQGLTRAVSSDVSSSTPPEPSTPDVPDRTFELISPDVLLQQRQEQSLSSSTVPSAPLPPTPFAVSGVQTAALSALDIPATAAAATAAAAVMVAGTAAAAVSAAEAAVKRAASNLSLAGSGRAESTTAEMVLNACEYPTSRPASGDTASPAESPLVAPATALRRAHSSQAMFSLARSVGSTGSLGALRGGGGSRGSLAAGSELGHPVGGAAAPQAPAAGQFAACGGVSRLSGTGSQGVAAAPVAVREPYNLRVVAHSLGGASMLIYLIMRLRSGRPHRLQRLVLLTPAGFHPTVSAGGGVIIC